MNEALAAKHISVMLTAVQRLRSILAEDGSIVEHPTELWQMDEDTAALTWKFLWGKNCIIPPLVKVIEVYETKKVLEPQVYYNMMYIATRLEPLIGFVAGTMLPDFPMECDINWLKGWTNSMAEKVSIV